MKNILYLCLAALTACSSAAPVPDSAAQPEALVQPEAATPDSQAALAGMQGSWVGPWILLNADAQPYIEEPFEAHVEIKGDRFTVNTVNAPNREPLVLTIKLSEGFDPPFIDLDNPDAPGEPMLGVYALSGGVLIICSGKQRPTGVLPCNGPNQQLLTLSPEAQP